MSSLGTRRSTGFDFKPQPPLEYEKVKVPRPVDLRRVAEWAGTSVAEIQELNPELRRWTTPVRSPDYEIKVPKGTAAALQRRLAELEPTDLASLKWYTVKRGDTLTVIARKLNVSRTDLTDANYLSPKASVTPGQNLIIPVEPTRLLASRLDRPVPVADSRPSSTPAVTAERASATGPADKVKVIYEVKPGDTLASVARLFQTSVSSLKSWNRLSGDRLVPGARLTIFTARPLTPHP